MLMHAVRATGAVRRNVSYDVLIGPCPGCQSWQLDYTDDVLADYAEYWLVTPAELLEDLLREHAAECPHLRELLAGARPSRPRRSRSRRPRRQPPLDGWRPDGPSPGP